MKIFNSSIIFFICIAISTSLIAADQVVTDNGDSGAGTLRQAIIAAGDDDEITFNLASGNETISILSELSITESLTINGSNDAGSGVGVIVQVTIPGTSIFRVFNIDASGETVNISNMTIKGGDISSLTGTASYGAVIYFAAGTLNLESVTVSDSKADYGGGIQIAGGNININNCTISNNTVTDWGGGIRVGGSANATVEITNTTISGNTSANYGGGFSSGTGNTITMSNSIFSNNTSTGDGGGISTASNSTLTSVTISGNESLTSHGGGIRILESATVTIENSTINSNSCSLYGGGVSFYSDGTLTINNSTISGNSQTASNYGGGGIMVASDGGGIAVFTNITIANNSAITSGGGIDIFSGGLTVKNSLIANNTAGTGGDYYYYAGTLTDDGYNIVEYQAGASNQFGTGNGNILGQQSNLFGTDQATQTLADNGGPTQTLALLSGSVADGAIPYSAGTNTFNGSTDLDQRGYYRAYTGSRDIGAYEYDGTIPSNGDYISTKTDNWSDITTWDTYNSTTETWADATVEPSSDKNVIISTGDAVTVDGTGDAANALTVAEGATLTISEANDLDVNGNLVNYGTFTINSSATGTGSLIVEGTATGDVDVQRYIPAWGEDNIHGWHFLSSPVTDQVISPGFVNINGTMSSDVDFYRWSESLGLWINIKNGSNVYNRGDGEAFFSNDEFPTFTTGKGYLVAYSTNQDKTFSGALTTSSPSSGSLSYTTNASYLGSHLIGNPYPCALEWNKNSNTEWNLTNLYATAKIWSATGASYTDLSAGGIIPAMQGFIVNVEASKIGSLTIYKGDRTHSSTAWYKGMETNKIKLTAHDTENGTAQESIIKFDPLSTENIDIEFDSYFMSGYAPLFYTVAEGKALSTNTLPELKEELSIPLYFTKNTSSTFYIEAEGIENLIPDYLVYLTDLKTNNTQNLTNNPVYSFTSEEGDDVQRFLLHFKSVGIEEPETELSKIQIWSSDKTINILNPEHQKGTIRIINIYGQKLVETQLTGNEHQELTVNVSAGNYIVNVISDNKAFSKKIFIRN